MSSTILLLILVVALFLVIYFFLPTKGEVGEKRVAAILSRLPEEEYKVVNNLLLNQNGKTTQIDHVVVSEYGVFVIETKNYSGWVYGRRDGEYWTKNMFGNKYKFRNPIHQNRGHISALMQLFPDMNRNDFISIVVFSPRVTLKIGEGNGVVCWNHLKRTILANQNKRLSPAQVEKIYGCLLSANTDSKEARKEHVKSLRKRIAAREQTIAEGKCPRCGGNLVLREGKYGKFYGCGNYPRCRFTREV